MRKVQVIDGEYYHIYNRGVDKRIIFSDQEDADRFFQSIIEFNTIDPIKSIYENSFIKDKKNNQKLVDFIAFSLVENHYHFILRQVTEKGIEKFMQRLGNGYTKYFNNKYKRIGSLFQGHYKIRHVDSNNYLLHLSVYVNLNQKVHQLGHPMSKLNLYSSWNEYIKKVGTKFCEKDIVLDQFNNNNKYIKFALSSFKEIVLNKKNKSEVANLYLE